MPPLHRWLYLSLLTAACLSLGQCGSPTAPPPPDPVADLHVICPVGVVIDNPPQIPTPVVYNAPTTTGGLAPTAVTCDRASGSDFGLGTTDVRCTANDSATPQRQASCVFSVTIRQNVAVSATKFLAFGDSITAGEVTTDFAGFGSRRVLEVQIDKAYPTLLRGMFAERYPQQQVSVTNAGSPGQPVICQPGETFCGVNDINDQLVGSQPQALLLLQGVVDLANQKQPGLDPMINGLKYMIRTARQRGVSDIFLGTLLPERQSDPGVINRSFAIDLIVPANDEIRALAAAEGVILVDVYAGMVGQEATLIGPDGLHPTAAGYKKIADIFFAAIKARLETVVPTSGGSRRLLRTSAPNGANIEVRPELRGPAVGIRQR